MIIHIKQIDPAGSHLEGSEDRDILDLEEPGTRALGKVEYDIEVGMSKGGLYATGWLGVDMAFTCVRCLETFPRRIEVQDFAMQTELTGSETVDLTPYFREDILLALPAHPHCDESGERECPYSRIFTEGRQDQDDRTGTESAWDILDQLKKK